MKKEERLHRLMGDIDDDLVAEAAHRVVPLKVWLPRVTAAVAAVALTVGIVLTQPWASEKPPIKSDTTITTTPQTSDGDEHSHTPPLEYHPNGGEPSQEIVDDPTHVAPPPPRPTAGTPTTTAPTKNEVWYEPQWDEKPIWMKFPDFERKIPEGYDGKMYYTVHESAIDAAMVEEYLEDVNLHGYDIYTETPYDVVGKIYRIEGINDACAVALQYEGRTDFFPAVNSAYVPKTLGQFITDLSLRENIRVGTVYYSYRDENGRIHDMQYSGLTVEKAWELLMSDTTLPNVADQPIEWKHKMSIRIDMPLLGYNNISISLSEDGYMRTNLLDTEKIFPIGKDKIAAFMEYVQENCRLQKDDELTPLPGDTTHPDTVMTSPAQPPLVTGTTAWKEPPV